MSSGACFVKDNVVIGEPVVRAVRLESRVAEYPRVIIGKNTVDMLRNEPGRFFHENIVQGDDGPYWVDPFFPMMEVAQQAHQTWKRSRNADNATVRTEAIRKLNSITDLLTANLYEHQEDRRTFSFYYWLYKYYRKKVIEVAVVIGDEVVRPRYEI